MAGVSEREKTASLAECLAAIEALTDAELRTLKRYATFMAFAVWGVFYSADAEDLFHDAIARTLEGVRKWKPRKVNMATHLKGCIRSIANQYASEAQHRSSAPLDEYDGHHVSKENWEEDLFRQATLEAVGLYLKPHVLARKVFEAIRDGFSPAEIRKMLNIGVKDYDAARNRIARCLQDELDRPR